MRAITKELALFVVLSAALACMALGTLAMSPGTLGAHCQSLDGSALHWLGRTVELLRTAAWFDFCDSSITRGSIVAGTLRAAIVTAKLVIASAACLMLIAVPLGMQSAHPNASALVRALRHLVATLSAMPVLVWASAIFIALARGAHIIPGDERHATLSLVVAVIALTFGDRLLADLTQRVELATRDVLAEPYMRMVRAGGFGLTRHLAQSLVSPVVTAIASRAMFLVSGAIVAELLFDLPGLGALIRESLGRANPDPKVALAAALALIAFGALFRVTQFVAQRAADARPHIGAGDVMAAVGDDIDAPQRAFAA